MQTREMCGKISIASLYEYLESDKAKAKIPAFLAGKKEKGSKKTRICTQEQLESKVNANIAKLKQRKINEFATITDDKSLSPSFRKLLRELNSADLEILLYGNDSDNLDHIVLEKKYIHPDEQTLNEMFNELDVSSFYSKIDKQAVHQFRIYFRMIKIIFDFFEKNNEPDFIVATYAYKMLVWFGFKDKKNPFADVESYFKNHQCNREKKPFHDSFGYEISDARMAIRDLPGWRKFILSFGPKAFEYFYQAERIENILGHAPRNMEEINLFFAKSRYENHEEDPELAMLCMQYDIDEYDFEHCLDIDRKTADNLPGVMVEGKKFGHPGYYIVKLPVDDLRTYVLGHILHNCLSVGSQGEQYVIDGMTLENNGFYVLLKGPAEVQPLLNKKINARLKIVGGCYAGLNQEKDMLLIDSWDNIREETDRVIVDLMPEFGRQLTAKNDIFRIHVGTGSKTPKGLLTNEVMFSEKMGEGKPCPDSRQQCLVYIDRKKLRELKKQLYRKILAADKKLFGMNLDALFSFILCVSTTKSELMFIEKLCFDEKLSEWVNVIDTNMVLKLSEKSSLFRRIFFGIMNILNEYTILNNSCYSSIALYLGNCINYTENELLNKLKELDENSEFIAWNLERLEEEGALIKDVHNAIISCPLLDIADPVIKLQQAGLLTEENIKTLLKDPENCYKLANALIKKARFVQKIQMEPSLGLFGTRQQELTQAQEQNRPLLSEQFYQNRS